MKNISVILIIAAVTAVLSYILHLFIKALSFGAWMIIVGLFIAYLGFGHEPDRPGMPAAGGGNRDVSPVNQGMMTEITQLGSKIPVNTDNTLLLGGVLSVLAGILVQLFTNI